MTDLVQLTYWDEATQTEKDCYPVVAQQSTRNVGEIIQSSLPLTDAGLHLLDGTLLQYGIYKEFIDYIADLYAENPSANYFTTENAWQSSVTTYGSCGKFVYDSVNNTVRLPKVTGIIEGTTDVTALGDLVEAGLPDHIHLQGANVMTQVEAYGSWFTGNGSLRYGNISQTAGVSNNPIYGNSSTVQPQTIKCFVYIVIATSSRTDIQVDIDEIATDLNNKMDRDCLNASDTGNIQMAKASMPSNKYIDLTLNASGSTYTAPSDGWFYFSGTTNNTNQYINVNNNTSKIGSSLNLPATGQTGKVFLPAKKGDIIRLLYNISIDVFIFIYAVGSESEAQ